MSARLSLPRSQQRHSNVAVVRYQHDGVTLEVPCYKNKVLSYRQGLELDVDEVLQISRVFTSVSRGEFASKVDIQKALAHTFEKEGGNRKNNKKAGAAATITELEAIKKILMIGEMQVGADERSEEQQVTRRDVVTMIAQKCIHPITRRPYPFAMIDQALNTIGFSIRTDQEAKPQALRAIHELVARQVLPIRRAPMRVRVCSTKSPEVVSFLLSLEAENILVRATAVDEQIQNQQQQQLKNQAAAATATAAPAAPTSVPVPAPAPQPPPLISVPITTLPQSVTSAAPPPGGVQKPPVLLTVIPRNPALEQQQQQQLQNQQQEKDKQEQQEAAAARAKKQKEAAEEKEAAAAAASYRGTDGLLEDVVADVSPDLFRKIDEWVNKALPKGSSLTVIMPAVVDTSEGGAGAVADGSASSAALSIQASPSTTVGGGSLSFVATPAATTPASLINVVSATGTPGRPPLFVSSPQPALAGSGQPPPVALVSVTPGSSVGAGGFPRVGSSGVLDTRRSHATASTGDSADGGAGGIRPVVLPSTSKKPGKTETAEEKRLKQQELKALSAKERAKIRKQQHEQQKQLHQQNNDDDGGDDDSESGGLRGKRRHGLKSNVVAVDEELDGNRGSDDDSEEDSTSSDDEDAELNRKERLKKQAEKERKELEALHAAAEDAEEAWKDGLLDDEEEEEEQGEADANE